MGIDAAWCSSTAVAGHLVRSIEIDADSMTTGAGWRFSVIVLLPLSSASRDRADRNTVVDVLWFSTTVQGQMGTM